MRLVAFPQRLPAFIYLALAAKTSAYTVFFEAPDPDQSNFQSHDVITDNACYQVSTSDPSFYVTGVGAINARRASPWSSLGRPGHGSNSAGTQNIRAIALYTGDANSGCVGDPTTIIRFPDDVPTGDQAIMHFVDLAGLDPSMSGVYRFWKPVNPDGANWVPYFAPENLTGYVGIVHTDGSVDPQYFDASGDGAVQTREYEDYAQATWMLRHWRAGQEDLVQYAYEQALGDLDEYDENPEAWIRKAIKTEEGALPPSSQSGDYLEESNRPYQASDDSEDPFSYWANAEQNAEQQQPAFEELRDSPSVDSFGGRRETPDDPNGGEVNEQLQQEGGSEQGEQGEDIEVKVEDGVQGEQSLWQEDWESDGINLKIEDDQNNYDWNNFNINAYDVQNDPLYRLVGEQSEPTSQLQRPAMVSVETQTSPLNNLLVDVSVQTDPNDPVGFQQGRPGLNLGNQNLPAHPQSLFIPTARRPIQTVTGQQPVSQVLQRLQQNVGPTFMNDNSDYIRGYLASLESDDPLIEATRPALLDRVNTLYEPGTPQWQQALADADWALANVQARERRRRLLLPLLDGSLSEPVAQSMVELGMLFGTWQEQDRQLDQALANYDLSNLEIPDPSVAMGLTRAQMAEMDTQDLLRNYLAATGRGPQTAQQVVNNQLLGFPNAYNPDQLIENLNPDGAGGMQVEDIRVKIEEE
ncbi:hypothetical protein Dda_1480 [Drechslerella dactyloides]|uniref:Uncharacterized protein n=1 Tax=Drechslerella dactyloides TaxID=74499 RepID=A0AAD6J346_DREDA|nr:hypothetical protein Dda_1480 [Drechslerella dactyloides]